MLYKIKYTNRFGSAVGGREDYEVAKLYHSEQSYCADINDVYTGHNYLQYHY